MAAYDIQVLVQALLYFVIVIFGFIIAVPLGLTVIEFDNHCVLYTEFHWVNATYATFELSNPMICNFPALAAVFTSILYGMGVGLYFLFAVVKSNDPDVGFQMWVMPFLLVNALVLLLMFISACIISVGLKSTCESILKGSPKSCVDAQQLDWNKGKKTNYNNAHFYSYTKTAEVACWIILLLWAAQMALGVLRFIRNRKKRSEGMGYDDEEYTRRDSSQPSDLENFASVNPSA